MARLQHFAALLFLALTVLCLVAIHHSTRVVVGDTPHPKEEQQLQPLHPITKSSLNGVSETTPLFVLSLPNSGSNALQRFFRCAGLTSTSMARYFINHRPEVPTKDLQEIGRCIHNNLQNQKPILSRYLPTPWSEHGIRR